MIPFKYTLQHSHKKLNNCWSYFPEIDFLNMWYHDMNFEIPIRTNIIYNGLNHDDLLVLSEKLFNVD